MSSMFLLKNKVCLITGCNRGIGKSIAELFAKEGAIVYANSRKDLSLDKWAVNINNNAEGKIIPQYYDITDSLAIKNAIIEIKKNEKHLDVLINNAGMMTNELFPMARQDTIKEMFNVNVYAVIELMQYALKLMDKNGGSIINIVSVVGLKGNPGQAIYSATKGAVISLTKSVAKEVASKNIRVNAVAPGLTDTNALNLANKEELEKRIHNIGMGRLASTEDIANACLFLASDLSAYITGQIISVDGSAII